MNVTISNPIKADIFTAIFQNIKLFTNNINVTFNADNMYIQSMDSGHVSVLEINIPAAWFDSYEHTHSSSITMGVHSPIFYKILSVRDKAQTLHINYDGDTDDKLSIHFTCENKAVFDRHFEISLMDIESELMAIPETTSNAEFTLSSANFAGMVNQLAMFGDTLDIICNEEKIVISSSNQETGNMSIDIDIEQLAEYSINEGETVKLSFSLNMLHNICAYSKIAKDVDIKLTNNYPMKVTYQLGDDAYMVFYLAPKIED